MNIASEWVLENSPCVLAATGADPSIPLVVLALIAVVFGAATLTWSRFTRHRESRNTVSAGGKALVSLLLAGVLVGGGVYAATPAQAADCEATQLAPQPPLPSSAAPAPTTPPVETCDDPGRIEELNVTDSGRVLTIGNWSEVQAQQGVVSAQGRILASNSYYFYEYLPDRLDLQGPLTDQADETVVPEISGPQITLDATAVVQASRDRVLAQGQAQWPGYQPIASSAGGYTREWTVTISLIDNCGGPYTLSASGQTNVPGITEPQPPEI